MSIRSAPWQCQVEAVGDGTVVIEEAAAVGERVRGDVQDSAHEGTRRAQDRDDRRATRCRWRARRVPVGQLHRQPPRTGVTQHDAGGFQPGDRDAERRAGDVVQADPVEEVHRVGVAAVLAADADLEVGPGRPAALGADPDQLADALDVEGLERGDPEDAHLQVGGEERGLDVVAGEPPGGLGQVVGAEGEELGGLGDLPGGQRRPRQLDHRPQQRAQLHAGPLGDLDEDLLGVGLDDLQLLDRPDQRDHDLRLRVLAQLDQLGGGLGDRPDLQVEQARHDQPQPDAAQAEHRVLLVQRVHGLHQPQVVLVGLPARLGQRHPHRQLGDVRAGTRAAAGPAAGSWSAARPSRSGSAGSPSAAAGAGRPAPASRASSSSARISRSTCWRRSPRNMCSVRHSPMPSPPNRRARSASSTVSAFARTRSRRTSSARPITRCTARTRSSAPAPSGSRVPSKYSTTGDATTGTSPA